MNDYGWPDKAESTVRIVHIGDVVGKPGMRIACAAGKWLKQRLRADVAVINAENAADGTGLRVSEYRRLIEAGYDAVTLGDHIYRKREIIEVLQAESNIVKPANFPPTAPGKTWCCVQSNKGVSVIVVSLLGRVYMRPVDCPFLAIDRVLSEIDSKVVIRLVDIHAEATSDKQIMGRYLDGRVSAVVGTHTHVATADEQILPKGTAYLSDVGMTGPFESILGRKIEPVLATTLSFDPNSFHVATGDVRISGVWVDVDANTGRSLAIGRIQWKESLLVQWESEAAERMKRL
jgi:2',3'-cyclic-nucleotide 2'-phosphodiesterase